MADYFSLDDPEDAKAMDAFYTVHVGEAPVEPHQAEILMPDVQHHNVMEGSVAAQDNEPTYTIKTSFQGGNAVVDVQLVSAEPGEPGERPDPFMSVWVEINEGVPAAHIYASADELVTSIFSMLDGNLHMRPGDGAERLVYVQSGFMPDVDEVIKAIAKSQEMPERER